MFSVIRNRWSLPNSGVVEVRVEKGSRRDGSQIWEDEMEGEAKIKHQQRTAVLEESAHNRATDGVCYGSCRQMAKQMLVRVERASGC